MSIRFRCKSCGKKYQYDDVMAGESFRCEDCGSHMQVPHQSTDLDTVVAEGTEPEILDRTTREPSTGTKSIVKVHSSARGAHKKDDIEFACKICGQKYRLAKEFAGHEAECAKCKRILIIPKYSDNASADSMDDRIVFWCKECGQKYRLPKNYAHNSANCSQCKASFVVPAVSESAPPEPPADDVKDPLSTDAGRPPVPPEHTEWLKSVVPKHHKEVAEKKQAPGRTRARIVQEALTSKSLQTQTNVEITGNPVSMVRYVLASPEHNIVTAVFSALIDWIRLFGLFKLFPRKLIGTFIVLGMLAAVVIAAVKVYEGRKAETRLVNTMCLDCKFIEAMELSSINAVRCSKCKGELGYPWKCYKCGKVFARAVSKDNENVLHLGRILPPDCPVCNSSDVKYLSPETPPAAKR